MLVFTALIGIAVIFLSYNFKNNNSDNITTPESSYSEQLEIKTQKIIESITGHGTAKVMITMKNTYIPRSTDLYSDFLSETTSQSSNFAEIPLPEIAGVMIVCSSLDNREDLETIKQAVATCLDIHTSKIYIIGGKPNEKNN